MQTISDKKEHVIQKRITNMLKGYYDKTALKSLERRMLTGVLVTKQRQIEIAAGDGKIFSNSMDIINEGIAKV